MNGFAFSLCLSVVMAGAAIASEPALSAGKGATAPDWPAIPRPPAGAPNVLLVMTDDVGFASTSTFGGPVPTPTFDALARDGLRYNRFHTTALCSPTRAALLTGRNPHNVEMGTLTNIPRGAPGYTTVIPKSAGTVAEILRERGYMTAAFGKWHLTPEWETSQTGPFDRWPNHMGFDHYYGFLDGSTDQFAPSLFENNKPISPSSGDPDYILDRDLADRAIGWIRQQRQIAPDRPFFAYYATGTAHSPHQAPKEWLMRFRGKFDQGWDVTREQSLARQKRLGIIPADTQLTPRPPSLPAWSSLSSDEKRVAARMMEAYAAALAFADHEIGRVIESLRASGQFDNTLVIFLQGDNGSSGEGRPEGVLYEESFVHGMRESPEYVLRNIDSIGGPEAASNYPAGWGWAMNTPFQYFKQVASHLGGVRNGLVISWPARIKQRNGIRSQFHFVSDIAPTILEAASIEAPKTLGGIQQKPLDGVSMMYSFDHPDAASHRRIQAFEMVQNLGIYVDGWWAGTRPLKAPWELLNEPASASAEREWELYDLSKDFSQARNLSRERPDKLAEMQQIFRAEARANNITTSPNDEAAAGRPALAANRSIFVYYPGLTRVPESAAPMTIGRSFTISADVVVDADAQGVLVAHGGRFGGYSLYLDRGHLVFAYNSVGERQYRVVSSRPIAPGTHRLAMSFDADGRTRGGPGLASLFVDGERVGSGRIEQTLVTWISHTEGLDIGEDSITPVSSAYESNESRFSGKLVKVTIELR